MKKYLSILLTVFVLLFFVSTDSFGAKTWKEMIIEDCTIEGGTIDNIPIGATTPVAGTFTTITGTATEFGTGTVSSTEIADVQRSFTLYLPAGMQDGGSDLDEASTPTLGETDNVPSIIWDDSSETTIAQWTFRLPPDFVASGACGVYALISSSEADGTDVSVDYSWFVNNDDVTFDATAIPETAVAGTSTTLDASNEVIDLAAGTAALAAFTSGTWVTFEVFNAGVVESGETLEIKGLEFYYQSTQ